jgi:outer membrane lipoprotein-sorting protein
MITLPAAGSVPPEAARLERALMEIDGLRADFVQIRDVALTGESIEATGFLAFHPPQAFRLVYTEPEAQELVIQGDFLWVVMPSENQAQRYPFSADAPGSEIFLLFGGQGRSLTQVFDVLEEPWGSHPSALRLIPRDMEPGYPIEEIRLGVGKAGFPQRLFFREVSGDTVVFNFVRVIRSPENIDELTRLQLPEGIEIIDGSPPSRSGGLPIDEGQ